MTHISYKSYCHPGGYEKKVTTPQRFGANVWVWWIPAVSWIFLIATYQRIKKPWYQINYDRLINWTDTLSLIMRWYVPRGGQRIVGRSRRMLCSITAAEYVARFSLWAVPSLWAMVYFSDSVSAHLWDRRVDKKWQFISLVQIQQVCNMQIGFHILYHNDYNVGDVAKGRGIAILKYS